MRTTTSRPEAIARAKSYNKAGLKVSLSYLPVPSYTTKAVERNIREYSSLIADIQHHQLDADITIKPQQCGTNISSAIATDALARVARNAREAGYRTWFDQELASMIPVMHEVALAQPPTHTGICIQAFRQRSAQDVIDCQGYPIRLVKGFYNDFDISPWSAVTENYLHLMNEIAKYSSYPCFATHDPICIEKAKLLLDQRNRVGEIQFFAGVRDDLARTLVQEGYTVRLYLPYGRVYAFMWYGLPIFDRVRALKRLLGYNIIT